MGLLSPGSFVRNAGASEARTRKGETGQRGGAGRRAAMGLRRQTTADCEGAFRVNGLYLVGLDLALKPTVGKPLRHVARYAIGPNS